MTNAINTQSLMPIAARPNQVFVSGSGDELVDQDGRRYLDFIQGWAVNALGHAPQIIAEALSRQAGTLLNCSPAFYNAPSIALAERLTQASGLDQVFFTNSGAEANEGAIKLARKWGRVHRGGAYELITFVDSFHGRTIATMSASGKPGWDRMFAPQVDGFPKAILNDLASVTALRTDKTVGVMIEPIQGEAGVLPAHDEFLIALREWTEREGLLLIADEVQTGMGRTGRRFGYEHAGITPDIVTLAKGIGGGVPLGALLATHRASVFEHGDQGGTFNGNPLMAAVGLAVANIVLDQNFLAAVRARSGRLLEALAPILAKHRLAPIRGRGLLLALDLGQPLGAAVVEQMREEEAVLVNSPRPNLLRLMPALNVSVGSIERFAAALGRVLSKRL